MVNFTLVPSVLNAIIAQPYKKLAVGWDAQKGLVAGLRNPDNRSITKFSNDNRMNIVDLIRVSAQRGGVYAR